MKIAFIGSREFCDKAFVEKIVEQYLMSQWVDYVNHTMNECVSGGARGVDSWAEQVAKEIGAPFKIFPADWDKHGKAAGFIRNQDIINYADVVVAFWDGESKGTKHSIDLAIKAKKPVDIYIRTGL